MMIKKIISGGQTGADRGGLDAAIELNIAHGGWCPKGRLAENGVIPEKYNLKEMNSKDYLKRTEQNAIGSDATIIFTFGKPSGGSKKTFQFCEKHNKPYLCVDLQLPSESRQRQIGNWLSELGDNIILNVAGSRESKAKGIEKQVQEILTEILKDL